MNKFIPQCAVILLLAAFSEAAVAQTIEGGRAVAARDRPFINDAPPAPPANQVSEEQLNDFAAAYADIWAISEVYSVRLEGATDLESAAEIQQEAQEKMHKAIIDTGLTVPDYQRIAGLAAQNEALRERIVDELTKENSADALGYQAPEPN